MVNLNKSIDLILAERLVSARKKTGITQKDMAGKLGIAVASLNRYERGVREVDIKVLMLIAKITKLPTQWFLNEDSKMDESDPITNSFGKEEEELIYQKKYEILMEKHITVMEENAQLRYQLLGKPQPLMKKKKA
tara:strand:+ start:1911 stop:2315 length:405 start_codon:yes stop_codon:yes gene_type:complete